MLKSSELPKKLGIPQGKYRLKYKNKTETMPGCVFVDGVTTEPVEGRVLLRQISAHGHRPDFVIEPWDKETAQLIADHVRAQGNEERAKGLEPKAAKKAPEKTQATSPAPSAPKSAGDLKSLSKAELRAFAKRNNIKVTSTKGIDFMRETIAFEMGWE